MQAVSPAQFSTFGDLLKYLRRRQALTQRELALQVGCSDTQISRFEQNQRLPDANALSTLFIPALHLEREGNWASRLFELARQAPRGAPPDSRPAGNVPPPNNLPGLLTSFIGRERDIAEVKQWLKDYRLVTLTGPGGFGKTRLALQIANDLRTAYEQGVWLVEFAPLSDPALITQAVAAGIRVRENPGADVSQTVCEYLTSRHILLVFDNCEHLIPGIARLVDKLLRQCPRLTILTTSREGLGILGEAIWTVPPLSLPIQKPWTDPTSVQETIDLYLQSESVQLFVVRAAAVSPEFSLNVENAAWVAEICRVLDGMPLAIELAASRVRALSVRQIAERLGDRFNLLTGGNRTAPLRQQTLAATLDWSYALLTGAERRVLQRLSIFAGGTTLLAAEAVCVCEGVKPEEVLGLISHLVEKSLLVADQSSAEIRYRLLETIRQYARQKLAGQGDEDEAMNRHLTYFMHWAEAMAPTLDGQDQLVGLRQFEIEHDNLRAALEWSRMSDGQAKAGLRLAAACGPFWCLHTHLSEGRRRLRTALLPERVRDRSSTHACALLYSAQLAYLQADYPVGQPLIEESLAIWRELGAEGQGGLAFALEIYGGFRMEAGDYEHAVPLFQESLDMYAQLHDEKGMSGLYKDLGWCAIRTGDYPLAQIHLEKGLVLAQKTGDRAGLNFAYSGLGEVAVRMGEYTRASDLLEKGLSLSRLRGDKWMEATLLGSLGWVALRLGDFAAMRKSLGDSLSLRTEIGDQGGTAWCLEKLAEAAVLEGQYQKAVKIIASAASLRGPINSVIDPVDQPEYERIFSNLRSKLDPKTFAACWAEGEAVAGQDMILYALSETLRPIDKSSNSDKAKFQGLSKRQRETAAWIAQGKSNREIAQLMTVSQKTVETYVTRILNKLGFTSRVQIATWAVEKGLISTPKQ